MEDFSLVIILFIFCFVCAVIGHRMAFDRGRSGDAWFFLCFLFGIFGPLFLVVLGDSDNKRKEKIEEEHRLRLEYEEKRMREKLEMEIRIRKEIEEEFKNKK